MRVPSPAVVVHDVVQNILLSLVPGLVAAPAYPLLLQGAEEAFRHRIVPAVALAAHAAEEAVQRQQLSHRLAGILRAPVGVEDQARLRESLTDSAPQGVTDEARLHALAHAPANDPAGAQVDDYRQIQPAFHGPDISNVRDIHPVQLVDLKFLAEQGETLGSGLIYHL